MRLKVLKLKFQKRKSSSLENGFIKECCRTLKENHEKKINESIEKTKPPILYLIFREDNVLVFVNCMPKGCDESELPYKINENGLIEIDAKGEEPLIVKKIGETEIELVAKTERGYKSPPLIFFFDNWTRLIE